MRGRRSFAQFYGDILSEFIRFLNPRFTNKKKPEVEQEVECSFDKMSSSKYSGSGRNPMKQIGNKNVGYRVDILKWSEKMDLLAIGNDKGKFLVWIVIK